MNMPAIDSSVLYSLMRKMERIDALMDRLIERGIITPEDVNYAELRTTISHAERIIKVRKREGGDVEDLHGAVSTIQSEMSQLSRKSA